MSDDTHDPLLFRNRYRIPAARWREWNYANPGSYFITICTAHRMPVFGVVANGRMHLSRAGMIVNACWRSVPNHFPHVTVGAHIVMPDHMHGIIMIGAGDNGDAHDNVDVHVNINVHVETCESHVSTVGATGAAATVGDAPTDVMRIRRPSPGSLGSIIGQFKSVCTKRIRAIGTDDFAWQARYHDRVIRNDVEMHRMREYIMNNPERWKR